MIRRPALAVLLGLFLAASGLEAQWSGTTQSSGAAEQQRLGVLAYHQGRMSESIFLFEKALAFDPRDPDIQTWLGRAYYRSGFEAMALKIWEPLTLLPEAPPGLASLVETLRARRNLDQSEVAPRYVEAARFDGAKGKSPAFKRPSSILPLSDASFLIVAHGSGQILRMDPNGLVKERMTGGLSGLDRPFSVVPLPGGGYAVSEFDADRIALVRKDKTTYLGSRGRGEGQVLGPQYLAVDELGYLYVTDYGNARVVKFDPDGGFILSLGGGRAGFAGLTSPAGLAASGGVLYVADSREKTIHRFDYSGNYLGELARGSLHFPEGLSFWNSGAALLVADTDRVVSIDLATERVDELYRSPDRSPRLVSAVAANNGTILAADFDASAVSMLNEAPSIARGFQVEIRRIDASRFPRVSLDVSVRDRLGNPVVGLSSGNFYLSEALHLKTSTVEKDKLVTHNVLAVAPAKQVLLEGTGTSSPDWRAMVLLERSPAMDLYAQAARDALVELSSGLEAGGPGALGLVMASTTPSLAAKPSSTPDLATLARALLAHSGREGRFDLGLRLAAAGLMPGETRDSIVYFCSGAMDSASFQGVSISELGALLANNGIRFHVAVFGEGRIDPSLEYIARVSGGSVLSASRPRGLRDLPGTLASAPSGRYRFSFVSADSAEFGNQELSVAVEAYLYQKSGRDELGYYAPLK